MMKNPKIRVSHSRKDRHPEFLQCLHPRLTQLHNCLVHLLFFRYGTLFFSHRKLQKKTHVESDSVLSHLLRQNAVERMSWGGSAVGIFSGVSV